MASALESLCGQAYGAKQYHMLGIYLQRSWIVLSVCAVCILPLFILATPLLKALGQDEVIAGVAGAVSMWFIPGIFSFIASFTWQMYLQAQSKDKIISYLAAFSLSVHLLLSWLLTVKFKFGLSGAMVSTVVAYWIPNLGQFAFIFLGGCPETWKGFSILAFKDLLPVVKLSLSSGAMLCLELWYYTILVLLTGNMENSEVAIDALSICLNINGWEMMISLGFLAAASVRVSNELGRGSSKDAKFAIMNIVLTSLAIGFVLFVFFLFFRENLAYIFTNNTEVAAAVADLSPLLATSILLNSVQPVLSGVAIGAGLQSTVAYVNIASYYVIGVPAGLILGYQLGLHVKGVWMGMIFGTFVQTIILVLLTYRTDWENQEVHTMSSRRGGRGTSAAGRAGLPKEKNIAGGSTTRAEQLSAGVAKVSLGSTGGRQREILSMNPSNRGGSSSSNPWVNNQNAWGQPDVVQKLGFRAASQPEIAPPLHSGWNWKGRPAASQFEDGSESNKVHFIDKPANVDSDNDDDSDTVDSDDELLSDDFNIDESVKSHDTRKQSRWFKGFFKSLDDPTLEQINEPARQWHCPACAGGPGAIRWYVGLQPLMAHAKTKVSKRVKVHRDFVELLDEEMGRRGTSVVPAGKAFGEWTGLAQEVKDREIVWPPMVCIMNTHLEQDDNDKWTGMGNQELHDYFSAYNPSKGRHSYGPQGHRGMSVLIFESSAVGYLDAERLHNHFCEQGSDRDAWNRRPKLFYAGGKSKLKFETKIYVEMVVNQLKQMSEDNQALLFFKNRVTKEQRHSKALEEYLGLVSENLHKTLEENQAEVRDKSKLKFETKSYLEMSEDNQALLFFKEEMDFQDQFFKDQLEMPKKITLRSCNSRSVRK